MTPKKIHKELAQRIIGMPDADIDGDFGPRSIKAAMRYMTWVFNGYPTPDRWVAAIIQRHAATKGINSGEPDAYWGMLTEDAAYRLLGRTFDRPDEKQIVAPRGLSPVKCWTPSDAQMRNKYGAVGTSQIQIVLPFPMRLAWDHSTTVTRTTCHKLAAGSLSGALEQMRDHYGLEQIRLLRIDLFGGVLNVRKKRGGSTWSAHSWGTAIDLDPDRNQLAWKRDRASFARPEYEPMRKAFADGGWMSLGTCYDFDHMHWQLNP